SGAEGTCGAVPSITNGTPSARRSVHGGIALPRRGHSAPRSGPLWTRLPISPLSSRILPTNEHQSAVWSSSSLVGASFVRHRQASGQGIMVHADDARRRHRAGAAIILRG